METALSTAKVAMLREGDLAHYRTPPHNNEAEQALLGAILVNNAFRHDLDHAAERQIETAEQRLFDLAESGQIEGGFQTFQSAFSDAIVLAEAAFKRSGRITGVATGFTRLDEMLGGLHPSDL